MDQPQNTEASTPVAPTAPQSEQSNTSTSGDNSTLMGILSYIGILVLIPLLTEKNNQFVRFHVRQGLVLLVIEIAAMVIGSMVWGIGGLTSLINLGAFVLSIIGIINVINKKQVALPLVGQFADKFKV